VGVNNCLVCVGVLDFLLRARSRKRRYPNHVVLRTRTRPRERWSGHAPKSGADRGLAHGS